MDTHSLYMYINTVVFILSEKGVSADRNTVVGIDTYNCNTHTKESDLLL